MVGTNAAQFTNQRDVRETTDRNQKSYERQSASFNTRTVREEVRIVERVVEAPRPPRLS